MKQKFLEVGRVVGTHGIKGMLRVQPWSDSGEFLTGFSRFYSDAQDSAVLTVERVQPHGGVVLLKLRDVDTVEAAEQLRGKILYINRGDVTLPEGRYFIDDLLGCAVFHANGSPLGTLTDVSQTGANDVWHITRDGREYLVPAVAEVIVSVDCDAERIVLNPMKGIFDDAD